jgi:putative ABC transport system substrate-binding protein
MSTFMHRRSFLTLLGGATAAWPLAARARQRERMRRIGVLEGGAEDDAHTKAYLGAFRQQLERLGWSEGRNVRIDHRFSAGARGGPESSQVLAKALVALNPDVIFAVGPTPTAALQRESRTIPVVFVQVGDPIGFGFVASLAGKWLQMLKEIAPHLVRAAFMANPNTISYDYFLRGAEAVAPSLAIEVVPSPVETPADIERTIGSFARMPNSGLFLPPGGTTGSQRGSHHRARGPPPFAGGLHEPCLCDGRRSYVLRHRSH